MLRVLACAAVALCLLPSTNVGAQVVEQKELRSTALYSPDGSVAAISIESQAEAFVELRAAKDYKLLHKFTDGKGAMEGLSFSPDSKELAAGCRDGNVYVWSVATGKLVQTLMSRREPKAAVAYLPDGSGVVALACEFRDERARSFMTSWSLDGKLRNVRQIDGALALGNSIPFSNGCALLRRKTEAGASQLVEVPSVDEHAERAIDCPLAVVIVAIPIADGPKVVIAGGSATPSADGKGKQLSPSLVVWDTKTKSAQSLTMPGDGDYSRALAVDREASCAYFAWPGAWIARKGSPGIREATKLLSAWDWERNEIRWTSKQKFCEISSIARAPKGRDLICCDRRGVWLMDADSGKVVRELR